ncbi:MAG TPA: peptidoglycan-binding protein [Euzebyales bacterium]|nr:peptidoglycan-binding protein [Euzebyales bacterium]
MTSDPTLHSGMTGREIADVQQRLARLGAHDLPVDGRFDGRTRQAVRQFQRDRGLPADGVVDPETWRALVEAGYELGDRLLMRTRTMLRGDDVMELQLRLNQFGFDAGTEDGIFGDATQAAVEEFQRNTGLTVDGRVGPETIDQLNRLRRAHQRAGAGVRARKRERMRQWIGQSLASRRLLIDPAHGPDDPGPVGPSGATDAEISWAIASQLAARLNAVGASAFLSRGPRTSPSGSERARLANELGVDAIISISTNALANSDASGAATYYFGTGQFVSEDGKRLAELLQDELVAHDWVPDCRVHPMTWAILRETRMTAVVVEPGFITSPADEARLTNRTSQATIAEALLTGITRFFVAPLTVAAA